MPLYGTFDTMQLADLAQWVHGSKVSGTLTISVETEETYLVFRRGELVALSSGDSLRLDLGQVLLNRGHIGEDQLHGALRAAGNERSLVDVLVEGGVVDEHLIARVQADHAFETVLDLFFHDTGSFHFSTAESSQGLLGSVEIPPSNVLKQPISTQTMIIEAMRRLDEWNRIREVFPSSYVVVHALPGESDNPVWQELRREGEPTSVGALCLRLGGSRFGVFRDLHEAYAQGLVGLDPMLAGESAKTHLAPLDVLIENARLLISERQFDEAREVLSTAIALNPQSEEARRLLKQMRADYLEHLYQLVPPHKVPLVAVDKERLAEFQLSPRETYLVSRINRRWDVATLVVATPLGELETLRILRKLIHAGIVVFA
jgi:hypothetical protein